MELESSLFHTIKPLHYDGQNEQKISAKSVTVALILHPMIKDNSISTFLSETNSTSNALVPPTTTDSVAQPNLPFTRRLNIQEYNFEQEEPLARIIDRFSSLSVTPRNLAEIDERKENPPATIENEFDFVIDSHRQGQWAGGKPHGYSRFFETSAPDSEPNNINPAINLVKENKKKAITVGVFGVISLAIGSYLATTSHDMTKYLSIPVFIIGAFAIRVGIQLYRKTAEQIQRDQHMEAMRLGNFRLYHPNSTLKV